MRGGFFLSHFNNRGVACGEGFILKVHPEGRQPLSITLPLSNNRKMNIDYYCV
jgi:hypothetical protein